MSTSHSFVMKILYNLGLVSNWTSNDTGVPTCLKVIYMSKSKKNKGCRLFLVSLIKDPQQKNLYIESIYIK